MASVAFSSIVINLASDLTQTLELEYGSGLQSQPTVTVSTSTYAQGVARKTRQKGYLAKLQATLRAVTPAQRVLLEFDVDNGGWLGETVCVRDFSGRKFYGYWTAPQITEHGYNDECDVSISFSQTTRSEAV